MVAIIGGFLGGFLAGLVGIAATNIVLEIVIGFGGAAILLFVFRALTNRRTLRA